MVKSNLDKQVARRLSDDDIRYTTGRRDVVNALHDAEGPQSAAELSSQLGSTIPLSSIYRTLSVLEESEIITPHFSSPGLTRYELSEWLTGHHHHLVCINCGRVEDVESGDLIEERIQEIVTDVVRASSFVEMSHALEIEGRCQKCA